MKETERLGLRPRLDERESGSFRLGFPWCSDLVGIGMTSAEGMSVGEGSTIEFLRLLFRLLLPLRLPDLRPLSDDAMEEDEDLGGKPYEAKPSAGVQATGSGSNSGVASGASPTSSGIRLGASDVLRLETTEIGTDDSIANWSKVDKIGVLSPAAAREARRLP